MNMLPCQTQEHGWSDGGSGGTVQGAWWADCREIPLGSENKEIGIGNWNTADFLEGIGSGKGSTEFSGGTQTLCSGSFLYVSAPSKNPS